jgi:hypothetical protein
MVEMLVDVDENEKGAGLGKVEIRQDLVPLPSTF